MGLYIKSTSKGLMNNLGKLHDLLEDRAEILSTKASEPPTYQNNLVCLVHNGTFEAARYINSEEDYSFVVNSPDDRPKIWLKYDHAKEFAE